MLSTVLYVVGYESLELPDNCAESSVFIDCTTIFRQRDVSPACVHPGEIRQGAQSVLIRYGIIVVRSTECLRACDRLDALQYVPYVM